MVFFFCHFLFNRYFLFIYLFIIYFISYFGFCFFFSILHILGCFFGFVFHSFYSFYFWVFLFNRDIKVNLSQLHFLFFHFFTLNQTLKIKIFFIPYFFFYPLFIFQSLTFSLLKSNGFTPGVSSLFYTFPFCFVTFGSQPDISIFPPFFDFSVPYLSPFNSFFSFNPIFFDSSLQSIDGDDIISSKTKHTRVWFQLLF